MSEPPFFPPPPSGGQPPQVPVPASIQVTVPPPQPRPSQAGWHVLGVLLMIFGGGAYVLESANAAACSSALTAGIHECQRDNLIHAGGLVALILGAVMVLYATIAEH